MTELSRLSVGGRSGSRPGGSKAPNRPPSTQGTASHSHTRLPPPRAPPPGGGLAAAAAGAAGCSKGLGRLSSVAGFGGAIRCDLGARGRACGHFASGFGERALAERAGWGWASCARTPQSLDGSALRSCVQQGPPAKRRQPRERQRSAAVSAAASANVGCVWLHVVPDNKIQYERCLAPRAGCACCQSGVLSSRDRWWLPSPGACLPVFRCLPPPFISS